MSLLTETVVSFLLITLTLWIQCGGMALLIAWLRHALPRDARLDGFFRNARFVVRFTTMVLVLHGTEILLWAAWYRFACFSSWESALYFSASSYSALGCEDPALPPKWRLLGPIESLLGILMCGVSVSGMFVLITQLAKR